MKFIKSRGSQKTRFSPIFKHFDTTSKNTYFHSFSQPQKQFKSFIHSINQRNHRKNHSFKEKIKKKKKIHSTKNQQLQMGGFYRKSYILQKFIENHRIHTHLHTNTHN